MHNTETVTEIKCKPNTLFFSFCLIFLLCFFFPFCLFATCFIYKVLN